RVRQMLQRMVEQHDIEGTIIIMDVEKVPQFHVVSKQFMRFFNSSLAKIHAVHVPPHVVQSGHIDTLSTPHVQQTTSSYPRKNVAPAEDTSNFFRPEEQLPESLPQTGRGSRRIAVEILHNPSPDFCRHPIRSSPDTCLSPARVCRHF